MERKSHVSSGFNGGLQRSNDFPRKLLEYQSSSSSLPRLPPIVQNDYFGNSSPPPVSRRQPTTTDKVKKGFSFDSKPTKQELLPKLERSQFETTTVYFKVHKDASNLASTKMNSRSELKSQEDDFKQDIIPKQEPSLSNSLLGIRRKKKDRLSSYKCSNNTVIDDEISQYEQRMGFEAAISTTTPKCVKDMKGRMIHSADVYNDSVTSLINMVDNDEDEKSKKSAKKADTANDNDSPKSVPEQKRTALRQRFLKALDAHFFNEFVNSKRGRRMAICEELEKDMIGDGQTSLTGLREHLRLQDVLDSWVL